MLTHVVAVMVKAGSPVLTHVVAVMVKALEMKDLPWFRLTRTSIVLENSPISA